MQVNFLEKAVVTDVTYSIDMDARKTVDIMITLKERYCDNTSEFENLCEEINKLYLR